MEKGYTLAAGILPYWPVIIAAIIIFFFGIALLAIFIRSCRADKLGFLRLQRWESEGEALQRVRYLKRKGFRRFSVPIDIARCSNQGDAVDAGELYLRNALPNGWQFLTPRIVGKQRKAHWYFEYRRVWDDGSSI